MMTAGKAIRWPVAPCALLLLACSTAPSDQSLTGQRWEVIAIDGASPRPGGWIDFEEDRMVGSAGCNRFNAEYTRSGSSLEVGAIAATKRFCAEEGVMAQEDRIMEILASVSSLRREGRRLVLSGDDGRLELAIAAPLAD